MILVAVFLSILPLVQVQVQVLGHPWQQQQHLSSQHQTPFLVHEPSTLPSKPAASADIWAQILDEFLSTPSSHVDLAGSFPIREGYRPFPPTPPSTPPSPPPPMHLSSAERVEKLQAIASRHGIGNIQELLYGNATTTMTTGFSGSCALAPVPPFRCRAEAAAAPPVTNATSPPQSQPQPQDRLHPRWQDIQLVAGLGDSITAGMLPWRDYRVLLFHHQPTF